MSKNVLQTVYKSIIQSILTFNITVWHGNMNQKEKNMLERVVKIAGKIIGIKQVPLSLLFETAVRRKARKIVSDPDHPLFHNFDKLPSGRRFRFPRWKKAHFKRSFIPSAISILNG